MRTLSHSTLASLVLLLMFAGFAAAQDGVQAPERQPSSVAGTEAKKAVLAKTPDRKVFAAGPKTQWIWGPEQSRSQYVLRREFTTDAKSAQVIATCDNEMTVWLNGKRILRSKTWERPVSADVSKALRPGKNELVAEVANAGSVAAFALKLVLGKKNPQVIVTDKSWSSAESKTATNWGKVEIMGAMGAGPWGNVFVQSKPALVSSAPPDVFQTLPGFQVDLLYTVPRDKQGSWVSMTFDPKGRIIASDQGGKGLYRITPAPIGSDKSTKVEKLNVDMTSAQGLLYAFDALYVSVNGGPGSGFYRLRDTTGDDQYDEVKKLKTFRGGGEHGPHAVRLSPDGKSLFVIAGNHTDPPAYDANRLAGKWAEDLLLPRQWDARGHAANKYAPGGWIAKTDPDGKRWEMFSIGYRNPYDMDFNVDGELFAYDADMEWDMGMPWYRPTRVVHATSGSEFGWRSGTGKWPTYYPDSLPPLVNVGPGSPVGATFGYGAKFPAKYQRALYILDWTFGTVYAIHMKAKGASYEATKEEFLSRTPLPLTDAAVGPDGALYFTVGGRNTQSALYRVVYEGDAATAPAAFPDKRFAKERAIRRKLETFHTNDADPQEAKTAGLQHLGSSDRHIAYAARMALEHQDIQAWRNSVLKMENPTALINGCIAIARQGNEADQALVVDALTKLKFSDLSEPGRLALLRAYALTFVRLKKADRAVSTKLFKQLDDHFPKESPRVNRELCRMLVYLNSPTVIRKTLALLKKEDSGEKRAIPELLARNSGYGGTIAQMLANMPDLQKLHYAFMLRNMRFGWTLEERKEYLTWLSNEQRKSGGASYRGFIDNMRKDALANASDLERKALDAAAPPAPPAESQLPKPIGPGKKWTMEEIVGFASSLNGRDFEAGRRAFAAAKCVSCHRFAGSGGATGPDLTNAAGRFSIKDLVEAVVHPSRVISDQYRASRVVTTNGKVYTGRLVGKDDTSISMLIDPVDATKILKIKKDDIEEMAPSKTSLMPANTFDTLNRDEVLDLLAYLVSRGDPSGPAFQD